MRNKSFSDFSEEVLFLLTSLKHYPGQHDQSTHGNRYRAHPTNPGIRLLSHRGGGPKGHNVDSDAELGPPVPKKLPKPKAGPLDHIKPSTVWQKSYHKKQDEMWSPLAAKHNMTLDEYKQAVTEKAKELVENADIWMRRSPDGLKKILTDGEFKTAFDVGIKPGKKYSLEQRTLAEKKVFGLADDLDPNLRPTYGYLSTNNNGGESWRLNNYGTVAIKLNDSLKDMTTITAEDSIGSTGDGKKALLIPKPMNALTGDIFNVSNSPNPHAPGLLDPLNLKSIDDGMSKNAFRYFETQTHRRIKTSDIKEVVFTYPPDSATKALLDHHKISWRVK